CNWLQLTRTRNDANSITYDDVIIAETDGYYNLGGLGFKLPGKSYRSLATETFVTNAINTIHSRSHSINSTSDHTSTIT
ncbi:hypothetical protein ACI3PL_31435, partial [Lacticaseibacillus paracasei]